MTRVDWNVWARFSRALKENTAMSAYSMIAVGVVGTIAHCVYGVLWLYVTPLDHENVWLRLFGAVTCFGLLLHKRWPESWKRLLPWYWFGVVVYTLPFFATYQLLGSNYSLLRSMLEVTVIFFVIVVFPQPILAVTNIALGMVLAVGMAWLLVPIFHTLNHSIVKSVHLQVLIYSMVAGMIFSRSNLKGLLAQGKIETMKALAGSIAHELRNPLSQLKHRLDGISQKLPRPTAGQQTQTIRADDLNVLYRELAKGKLAIERGLQVIAMTLDEINARPINAESLRYLSAATATRNAVEEFSYESAADRERVSVEIHEDFVFKGDETRYAFVLFNLLSNAVYYFSMRPTAQVTITVAARTVTVQDTGPGMSPEVLARVFESFHTAGKPGGTGLGLAYCKRTMAAFGGDITCESEQGRYTRFVLRFPQITDVELEQHRREVLQTATEIFQGKRLLIVDDVASLRATTRAQLKVIGVEMDEADNGQQALQMLAQGHYDAMMLDLGMPVLDGYATAEAIRAGTVPGKEHFPIVVYTADSPYSARVKLEKVGIDAFVQKPCSQLELVDALCRAVEAANRRAALAEASATLAGRVILLADDQPFNRKYLRSFLVQRGATVLEASSAAEVLSQLHQADVDVIVTDINMPGGSGLEMTRAIREMPAPLCNIPVIALTAHSDERMAQQARAAGMNDFLVKPVEPMDLLDKLARILGTSARPPAAPAAIGAGPLVDSARLERMCSLGLAEQVLPEALDHARSLLARLRSNAALDARAPMREDLHALLGIAGEMGAKALGQQLRSVYAPMVEDDHWPADGAWLDQAQALFEQTEAVIRARHLQAPRAP